MGKSQAVEIVKVYEPDIQAVKEALEELLKWELSTKKSIK